MTRNKIILAALAASIMTSIAAGETPLLNYRNGGTGVFPDAAPPLEWSNARNVAWAWDAPIFDMANSSPIVVGDRLFTLVTPNGLVCLDKHTGKELWRRATHTTPADGAAHAAEQWLHLQDRLRRLKMMVMIPYATWTKTRLQALTEGFRADLGRLEHQPAGQVRYVAGLEALVADAKTNEQKYKDEIAQLEASAPEEAYPGSKLSGKTGGGWSCAAPPASDGASVYAIYHPGLVVCYDLDGNRKWVHLITTPEGQKPGMLWGLGGQSPVPVDGKLLAQQGDELQCLDAATGKLLWRRYHKATATTAGPAVGRGGDGEWYFATPVHGIGRVNDGEIVFKGPKRDGYFPVTVSPAGDIFHYIEYAVRLPRKKGDACERLPWTLPDAYTDAGGGQSTLTHGTSMFCPAAWSGDLLFWHNTAGNWPNMKSGASTLAVFDANTGKLLREPSRYDNVRNVQYPPIIVGGRHVFVSDNSTTTYVYTADPAFKVVARNTLSMGYGKGKLLSDIQHDHSVAEGNMGPVCDGSRIYFRTMTHLYCIARVVAGTAQDDPKIVAAIRAAKHVDEVSKYLKNDSAQYRYEALLRLAGLGSKDLAPEVQKAVEALALGDPQEEIRVAALRVLGLEAGQPGFALLRARILKDIHVHQETHTHQSDGDTVMTVKTLGAEADPVLVSLLTDPHAGAQRAGAAAAGLWAKAGAATRNALVALAADRSAPNLRESGAIAAGMALGNWPADPKVTALFEKLLSDDQEKAFHPPAMQYLMGALPDDRKNAVLVVACKAGLVDHASDLAGRGAVDALRSLVGSTTGKIQAGLVEKICSVADQTGRADLHAVAHDVIQVLLKQPEPDAAVLDRIAKLLKKTRTKDAAMAKTFADDVAEIERRLAQINESKKGQQP
jgi:outer membrane protein assembly factor BamB